MTRLRDRPTGEVLVLGIAVTVCVFVLIVGVGLVVVEVLNPDADTSAALGAVADVVSTFVGVVAGYLAGRTDRNSP